MKCAKVLHKTYYLGLRCHAYCLANNVCVADVNIRSMFSSVLHYAKFFRSSQAGILSASMGTTFVLEFVTPTGL